MHRFITALLGFGLAFALAGCGGAASSGDTAPIAQPPQPAPPSAQPAPQPEPQPAPPPAPQPDPIAATVAWKPVWGDVATAKLRPGSRITPSNCTAGFLYVDPVQQIYYLGTAAHCSSSADDTTQDGVGTRVGLEDPVTGEDLGEIGTVVFDSDGPISNAGTVVIAGGGVDFTLIQLDPGINLVANPQAFSLQGPTGYLSCAELVAGDPVGLYGNGTPYYALGLEPRIGAVVRCNALATTAEIAMPIYNGDSGSAVLHLNSGKAIGHASAGLYATLDAPTMDYVFNELAAAGFGNVALATIDGGYAAPR